MYIEPVMYIYICMCMLVLVLYDITMDCREAKSIDEGLNEYHKRKSLQDPKIKVHIVYMHNIYIILKL